MRFLLILVLAVVPAVAQSPVVQLTNATHPSSKDFRIGDRFELVIVGAANQPVSVRTSHGLGSRHWLDRLERPMVYLGPIREERLR
jgi:hypothetical protein